jgi:transglutaminase-like putative cysteine protease
MLFDNGAREQAWDKNLQLLLVAIIAFNILPHMSEIPVWSTGISFAFLIWKLLSLYRGVARPPRWLLYPVAFGCSVGVFFEYGTIIGQEPASALLVTLASAKLLETNRYRDAMFVIFTSFFLLMAHLLESQSILTTIYMAVDVMLITALMFQLHKQERRRSARSFRPVMKTLGLAIPVWIFLFIAFPRFSAGLWGQQQQEAGGGSFSQDLDPGSISSLVDSDETSFRVKFDGRVPSLADLYWRGGILTEGNGLLWKKSKEKVGIPDVLVPSKDTANDAGRDVSYEVYLEPRFQSWIFALDYPLSISMRQRPGSAVRKRPGFTFENAHPSTSQAVYEGVSTRVASPQRMLDEDRKKVLQLPDDLDPRVAELGRRLAVEAQAMPESNRLPSYADRLAFHVEEWFDQQGFRYTKSPGAMKSRNGSQQLAEFLFEKKVGFCEHYAAAFATLMRAAGVPARVTVGFLGASKNMYSDYYLVRDLDAHAWAEIWREDETKKGIGSWVRVDPTALIAPLRLQMGGDFNLLDSAFYRKDLSQTEAELSLHLRNSRWFHKASMAWDALQMKWISFLNDFDFDFQKSFLEALGLKNVTRWFLFGVAALGITVFAIVFSIVLRRRAHKVDPVVTSWRRLCKKLDRAGLKKELNEGPIDFTARAAEKFPGEAERLRVIGEQYALLRYGPNGIGELRELRRAVRSLKIKAESELS